jgi:hypothetical protein
VQLQRASTEDQESWYQPWAFERFPPLLFMGNQTAGSEVIVGPKEGAKIYWVARVRLATPR